MKILVTGGAGFIGSHIVDRYIKLGHEVVVVDNLFRGKKNNINPKAKFYQLDICSDKLKDIFAEEKPDIINHHAAMINVRESVECPILYEKNNIIGLINLLENCKNFKVKKIINVSSGGVVYGNPISKPTTEDEKFDPESPYGITKVAGEYWVEYYRKQYNINYTTLRYANIYGPRQSTQGGAGVIAIFATSMINNDSVNIFGDGQIARDYVYIDDVVDINEKVINHGDNQAYNVGTKNITTVNQIFEFVKKYTDYKGKPIYLPEKPGEVKINYLDNIKAKNELNWEPKTTINIGIKQTIEYFKNK